MDLGEIKFVFISPREISPITAMKASVLVSIVALVGCAAIDTHTATVKVLDAPLPHPPKRPMPAKPSHTLVDIGETVSAEENAELEAAGTGFNWGGECGAGSGSFTQQISKGSVVLIGLIPGDKTNVKVMLDSKVDIDLELFEKESRTWLVGWKGGQIAGPGPQKLNLGEGAVVEWSGYNGNKTKGHETLAISKVNYYCLHHANVLVSLTCKSS